jgi:hypothetical protein
MAAAGAVAVLSIVAASSRLPQQPTTGSFGVDSSSSSVGPVSASVIGSWTAHGANDVRIDAAPAPSLEGPPLDRELPKGGVAVAPPAGTTVRPFDFDRDWMLDLLVLWRWPGHAPEMTQGGGGDRGPGIERVVHRIVAGGRELRVDHDPRAGTALLDGVVLVQLAGANVLMLDVGEQEVTVAGTATIPRYASRDAVEAAIASSAEVAAFVGAR